MLIKKIIHVVQKVSEKIIISLRYWWVYYKVGKEGEYKLNSIQLLIDIMYFKRKKEISLPKTRATFKAFVEATIPINLEQSHRVPGLYTEEYLIWMINHLLSVAIGKKQVNIPMSNITAEMLNRAAKELIDKEGNDQPIDSNIVQEKGLFAALDPSDRLRTISLLEEIRVDLANLPIPFWKNSGFVLAIVSVLTLLTTFGYYTEWSTYDLTQSDTREKRIIKELPNVWKEVGYPGTSKGYHAFRGYLD